MDSLSLLDQKDKLSYEILSIINQTDDKSVDMEEVITDLNITAYKLDATLTNINNDLFAITKNPDIRIVATKRFLWRAENISNLVVEKLKLAFLKRSPNLPAFEYLVFFDKQFTPNQYLDYTFVSRAVFYRKLKTFRALVNRELVPSDPDAAVDSEFQNRLILFQLYYAAYNGLDDPFTKLNDVVEDILNFCNSFFETPLRLSQRYKLSIFIRIWIMRQLNQNYITTQTVDIAPDNTQYNKLFENLKIRLQSTLDVKPIEVCYFYGFLLAKGYIRNHTVHEVNNNFPLANEISQDFLDWVRNYQITESFSPKIEDALYEDLININLQLTSFYIEPTTFIRENSMTFFGKTYPSFDIIITRFLDQIEKRYGVPMNKSSWTNLYYGYMFALINNIPVKDLKERVYITADFSQGDLYTQYVINSLDAFHHANIIIEPTLTSHTDIYVSDVYSRDVSTVQLTWEDPPTPKDWSNLGSVIELIRTKKAAVLFT